MLMLMWQKILLEKYFLKTQKSSYRSNGALKLNLSGKGMKAGLL